MIQIKANEALFKKWRDLGTYVRMSASIIQNDMEVSEREIIEWSKSMTELIRAIADLRKETMRHCGMGKGG